MINKIVESVNDIIRYSNERWYLTGMSKEAQRDYDKLKIMIDNVKRQIIVMEGRVPEDVK